MSDAALDVGCAPNLSENSSTNRQGDIGLVSVSARSSFTQPESGQESTSPTSEAESGDTSSETGPAQDAVEDATNEHGVAADADGVISMSKNALIERPLVTTSPTIATSTSTENDMDDTVQKRDMMYQNDAILKREKAIGTDFRKGASLLYMALEQRSSAPGAVSSLLDSGYDVNARHGNLETPLHLAVREGDTPLVVRLLDANANTEGIGPSGYTALHYAAHYHQPAVASVLVQRGADINGTNNAHQQTPLYVAARDNSVAVAGMLIQHGANIDAPEYNMSRTPAHIAALYNHFDVLQLLLEKSAQMNVADAEGNTPLMLAAKKGNLEAAAVLAASSSVNTDARVGLLSWIGRGWTAADLADAAGFVDVAQVIREQAKKGLWS
eukprot:m.770123 g.770123  ORF g.770123 m.770123 type:complete len:384 (-) comp23239_c0_seq1:3533-4684(-)